MESNELPYACRVRKPMPPVVKRMGWSAFLLTVAYEAWAYRAELAEFVKALVGQ